MAGTKPHGYHALEPAAFADLDDRQAEELVETLVRRELAERHAPGFEIDGPRAASVGGADLRVRLHNAPPTSFADFQTSRSLVPMTFDDLDVSVVYSVKSGKKWRDVALAEAKDQSQWALDALGAGGRLIVVLTTIKDPPPPTHPKNSSAKKPSSKKNPAKRVAKTFRPPVQRELADAYLARLRLLDVNAPDPHERIHVFDANDLSAYVRATGYVLSASLRLKLRIPGIPRILDLSAWLRDHQVDRAPAPRSFEWDDARTAAKQMMLDLANNDVDDISGRAIWLVAPPGIGKTRLVVEAFRSEPSIEQRIFVAPDPQAALSALHDHELLGTYKDAILVVDDCSLEFIAPIFRALAQGCRQAKLIVITPLAETCVSAQVPPLLRVDLMPMDQRASANMVALELGWEFSDPRVANVVTLTEGYPWFALLVARELAKATEPGARLIRTLREAVDLALCPPRDIDFELQVRQRAAALFAVMLLEAEVIADVEEAQRAELLPLLGFESWQALERAIERCAARGLLRRGDGGVFRYVTPAIIEREIAKRFLTPPGPGGPGPFRLRLRSEVLKKKLAALLERMEKLGFPPESLAQLALPTVLALDGKPAHVASLRALSTTELLFAARHQPQQMAAILWRIVEETPLEALRANLHVRRSLMFALESVAERQHTFHDAEAALFRLALAENETYANNATTIWAGLFDVASNTTYLTFSERQPTLEDRVRSAAAHERLIALAALGRLTGMSGLKVGGRETDGRFPRATRAEVGAAFVDAWRLLLERVRDEDTEVRSSAARTVARNLRTAVRSGLIVAIGDDISALVDAFPKAELGKLLEAIDLAVAHDLARIERTPAEQILLRLRDRFAPTTYRDRLRHRVGAWGPVALRDDVGIDRDLAIQGLRSPSALLEELDWLTSAEAVRAMPFAITVGLVDEHEVLLESFLARAPEAPAFVSAYLTGRQLAGAVMTVDRVIQRFRADGLVDAAVTTMWRAGYSPDRLEWLIEDLKAGRVSEQALSYFAFGGWQRGLSDAQLDRFVTALLSSPGDSAARVALDSIEHHLPKDGVPPCFRAVLLRAFERASMLDISGTGHFAYVWQQAALRLVAAGVVLEVAQSAVNAIVRRPEELPRDEVSEVVVACARADGNATWIALRRGFESDVPADVLAHGIKFWNVSSALPADEIAAWMGTNKQRSLRAVELVSMHGPDLAPLAREILRRFGPESDAAEVLMSDLLTTPRAVSSLATFSASQLERVRPWLNDPAIAVREFAERALALLGVSRDQYAAHEESERRQRSGT